MERRLCNNQVNSRWNVFSIRAAAVNGSTFRHDKHIGFSRLLFICTEPSGRTAYKRLWSGIESNNAPSGFVPKAIWMPARTRALKIGSPDTRRMECEIQVGSGVRRTIAEVGSFMDVPETQKTSILSVSRRQLVILSEKVSGHRRQQREFMASSLAFISSDGPSCLRECHENEIAFDLFPN